MKPHQCLDRCFKVHLVMHYVLFPLYKEHFSVCLSHNCRIKLLWRLDQRFLCKMKAAVFKDNFLVRSDKRVLSTNLLKFYLSATQKYSSSNVLRISRTIGIVTDVSLIGSSKFSWSNYFGNLHSIRFWNKGFSLNVLI